MSTYGRQIAPHPSLSSILRCTDMLQMDFTALLPLAKAAHRLTVLLLHPDPPTCHLLHLWTAYVISVLISHPTNKTAKQPVWFSVRPRWVHVSVLLTIRSVLNSTNQGVGCFAVYLLQRCHFGRTPCAFSGCGHPGVILPARLYPHLTSRLQTHLCFLFLPACKSLPYITG